MDIVIIFSTAFAFYKYFEVNFHSIDGDLKHVIQLKMVKDRINKNSQTTYFKL